MRERERWSEVERLKEHHINCLTPTSLTSFFHQRKDTTQRCSATDYCVSVRVEATGGLNICYHPSHFQSEARCMAVNRGICRSCVQLEYNPVILDIPLT